MRIAVDAVVLELPCPTGVERAAQEIVRALAESLAPGDELIVFGRDVPHLPVPESRHVRAIGLGGREPPVVWREARLAPALRGQAAHVLWSPVAALPYRTDVPRVATIHELPWLVRPGMEGALRERVHRTRLHLAAHAAAILSVPSRVTAAQVAHECPEAEGKIRVVPHGVPALFTRPLDARRAADLRALHRVPQGPFALHVGGTRARKDVPLVLRAFARYRLRGGRLPLVMVGPGDPPPRMAPGTWYLGYVSDDLLRALYGGAAALVVASASEGFGLPCLEAMASDVPVVATRTGALPEVVGDAALLSAPDDEALADALLRLEAEPGLRAGLVERGRARARSAGWDRAAALLRAAFTDAVGTP